MATKTYKGQSTVTVVRAAKQGDDGYDASKDQTLIRLSDGTEKVVLSSELTT